jgi:hypothetical protein
MLQDLQNLGLEEAEAEVMVCNVLARGLVGAFGQEAMRGHVFVFEERWKGGGDYLVGDAEGAADASAHEAVKRICAPPEAASEISDPLSSALLSGVRLRLAVGGLPCLLLAETCINIFSIFVM